MKTPPTRRQVRDARIFEAVLRGETGRTTAAESGLTPERCRQIVHRMCRMMMYPQRLGQDVVPDRSYGSLDNVRFHSVFWLTQLAKWKKEKGVEP